MPLTENTLVFVRQCESMPKTRLADRGVEQREQAISPEITAHDKRVQRVSQAVKDVTQFIQEQAETSLKLGL